MKTCLTKCVTFFSLLGLFVLYQLPLGFLIVFIQGTKSHFLSVQQILFVVASMLAIIALTLFLSKWQEICDWTFAIYGKIRYIFIGYFLCFGASYIGSLILSVNETQTTQNQAAINFVAMQTPPLIMWFLVGVGAPIIEEVLFRGGIIGLLFKEHQWIGLFVNAFLFGLVHSPSDLGSWVIYGGMGAVLGFLYLRTKRLEVSVMVHMIINTLAVIVMYMGVG